MEELDQLLAQITPASSLRFERSVFINWSCSLADCTYCYLSTQPKASTFAKRSVSSILAEVLLCKHFGWHVDYVTGGIGVQSLEEQKQIMKGIHVILGHPVAINLGPMSRKAFEILSPDISGVGVAIESFLPAIQAKVCPSKPHGPFLKTISISNSLGLQNLITIILGLGEKKEDFPVLATMIKEHGIQKIQFCFLKPQKGTVHEHEESPSSEYAAWWIAKTRVTFPDLKLKIAITKDRLQDLPLLHKAGISSFSRFPVIKKFGSSLAHELEDALGATGVACDGRFTSFPDVDWDAELDTLDLDNKDKIREKMWNYLESMGVLKKLI